MKPIFYVAALLAGAAAIADEHEQFQGIALDQGNAIQMNICRFNDRKTMSNYDRVFNDYIEWSKDNDAEVFVLRLTPVYGGPVADGPQFDFIDLMISTYGASGDAWNKWLTGEEGQKLNAQWGEAADCTVSINPGVIVAIDREALSARDDRLMTFNWCTRNDGVSWDQVTETHRQMASNYTTESPIKAWTVMFPGLGMRNPPGEYAHLISYEDANGLMAFQNDFVNNDGWRRRVEYEANVANCGGENVYYAEVLNRPGA